jgi:hypothetical protein
MGDQFGHRIKNGIPMEGIPPIYATKPTGSPFNFINIGKVDCAVLGSDMAGHIVTDNISVFICVMIPINLDCPTARRWPATQINLYRVGPTTSTTIHRRMSGDIAKSEQIIAGVAVQIVATIRAMDSVVAFTSMNIIVTT